jgi:hypothetical protein
MPRFEPPEQDEESGKLGPQRVPGIGPHPGQFGPSTTGPIPVIAEPAASSGSWQQPGAEGVETGGDSFGTVPTPATGAEFPAVPAQPFANEWSAPTEVAAQEPAAAAQPLSADQPAQLVLGAPVSSLPAASGGFLSRDSERGSTNGGVIVPPAASLGEENRLPIFEAVESDWFRRGRPTVDVPGGRAEPQPARAWTSPSDEGWKAAEAAVVPSSGGTTVAGLPRRVPKANLIPGTAAETVTPVPVRSAAATRERFASLQRGMREGRAASGAEMGDESADETSDVPGDG